MEYEARNNQRVFRYKGFVLIPQAKHTWLIRPERSPMVLLPFRTNSCSLEEAKSMVDDRLAKQLISQAA